MSKRPYYLITRTVETDGDGFNSYTDYVGCNLEAAKNRLKYLRDEMKRQYFLDRDIPENEINITQPDWSFKTLEEHRHVEVYMNDGDYTWITIVLKCIKLNEFTDTYREQSYKRSFPDTKY